jgi:prespore-specific regulator
MKVRQDAWTEENDLLLAETVLRHVREGSTQLNAFEEVGDKLDRTSAACGFRWNAVVRHNYEKALQLAKKQRKQRQRILGKDQGGKKKLLYAPPVPVMDESLTGSLPVPETSDSQITFDLSMLDQDDKQLEAALMAEMQELMNDKQEKDNYSVEAAQMEEAPAAIQKPQPAPQVRHTIPSTGMTMGHVIAYLQSLNGSTLQVDIYKSENERLKREINSLRKQNDDLQAKVNELENNTHTMQEDYETLLKIMNRARKLVLFEEEERPATKFKMDRNGNLEKVAE